MMHHADNTGGTKKLYSYIQESLLSSVKKKNDWNVHSAIMTLTVQENKYKDRLRQL